MGKNRRQKPDPASDPYIGMTIDGRFHLRACLGRGGMGMVYRAEQDPLGRQVALKLMLDRGEPDREDEFKQRFFLEAATVAKLIHPNTVTVFDYGSDFINDDRVFFIVMEYIEGRTLARAIKKDGPFSASRAAHVGI
ncbi:MAG: protein kinase [Deltaproteobacteria bacterium]|nr:protein kinase [Deltaproteobacteria bacterium]